MASKLKKRKKKPTKVSHYLTGWAEDAEQTRRHLAEVIVDALCALKRLEARGTLDAYPSWKGEGSATIQLGIPEGSDARYLKQHPFLPPGTPLAVVTGTPELTVLMVGFSRGVSTRWRKRIVSGSAAGPGRLPVVMKVDGANVLIAQESVFAEHRVSLEEAGWTVQELTGLLALPVG